MANDKYYVVTQGEYSDYHIVAVTSDREIAEKIAAKFTGRSYYDECRIEEYGDAEVMLKPAWLVYFDKNGNVDGTRECDSAYDYENIGIVREYNRCFGVGDIIVTVSADAKESAIKIAAEKRAQYLAEHIDL